jgi:hypothetical protein
MGIYVLGARLAFGLSQCLQVEDTNSHAEVAPHIFYRAGEPGRWIITRGEDAVVNNSAFVAAECAQEPPRGILTPPGHVSGLSYVRSTTVASSISIGLLVDPFIIQRDDRSGNSVHTWDAPL